MPRTPAEIVMQSLPSKAEIAALENEIDAALTDSFKRGVQTLHLNFLKWFKTKAHYSIISEHYAQSGWVVTYTGDQRDGDFVTIKPK